MFVRISTALVLLVIANNALALPNCCQKVEYQDRISYGGAKYNCKTCTWNQLVQHLSPNASYISLSGLNLKSIPSDAFAKFPNLQILYLISNPLQVIHANAFRGLTKLRFLYLDTKTADLVQPFSHISQLQQLQIALHNKTYPSEAIAQLKNLTKLTTTAPHQQAFGSQLKSLTKLETLQVSSGNISLSNDTFTPFTKITLKTLILQKLRVNEVSQHVFTPLHTLENLVICDLRMVNLSTDLLDEIMKAVQYIPSERLTTLSVDCVRAEISEFSFQNITSSNMPYNNLQRMNFRANTAHNIGLASLLGLSNMTYLSLAHTFSLDTKAADDTSVFKESIQKTKLSHLDITSFNSGRASCRNLRPRCLRFLEVDDLFLNESEIFGGDSIPESHNLTENSLSVSNLDEQFETPFKLTSKDTSDFYYFDSKMMILYHYLLHKMHSVRMQNTNLVYAMLSLPFAIHNSQLRFLDLSYNNFYQDTNRILNFTDLTALIHLNFSHNSLNVVPNYLENLHTLVTLDLSHNQLNTVNFNGFFRQMKRLKRLFLTANMIAKISPDAFTSLQNLEQLWLNDNYLSAADFELPTSKSLHVFLDNNYISHFSKTFMDSVDGMAGNNCIISINAKRNIFQCNCETVDFIRWLHSTKALMKDKATYICATDIHQRKIVSIDTQKLTRSCHPNSQSLVIPAIIIPITTVLILVAAAWCYCKRWTVRWYTYQLQLRLPCTTAYKQKREAELKLVEEKIYDVAVLYDLNDAKYMRWIHETLLPTLQGWNLQVFYMDDLDKDPMKAFLSVVESCHNYLFVLTPNFVEGDLCNHFMYMVLPSHLQDMVFIELERIPEAKNTFASVLHRIKASAPNLTYPQLVENLPTFWSKLNKTLVHKTNQSLCTI